MQNQTRILLNTAQNRERAKAIIDLAADAEVATLATFQPYKRNRSLDQNALYWKWITIIGVDLGATKEELHEDYKLRFLVPILTRDNPQYAEMVDAVRAVRKAGMGQQADMLRREIVKLTSTTELTTAQMAEYMDDVNQHAASLGIILPQPEDRFAE